MPGSAISPETSLVTNKIMRRSRGVTCSHLRIGYDPVDGSLALDCSGVVCRSCQSVHVIGDSNILRLCHLFAAMHYQLPAV